ncbi:coiled-coil domain-containing protein [Chitinophaga sancti]|uniref:J domain-containing protein n=1 Tax=Chitinophaga sancti TaxID=1004 RepID=A0A1K1RAD3_9BACT|nr:hypothetical protein [Chitinophaga sancti]WQD65545.1 hypothetical protein U0033_14185 [Chitinophaga sancti]WQG88832.1 hypothetical protein SR876_28285 [Chitinophaga sancti]SFW69103.1 hypothetical protein SAMN05661012_03550 [Chitinophaga sancti]
MSQELEKRQGELNIKKSSLSKEQKTFNKLIQQIAALRQELAELTAILDKQRQHYIKHIYPFVQQLTGLRAQLVVLMNGFMTLSKGLSDYEKEDLRGLILHLLQDIFRYQQGEPEGELLDIFNALSDTTYQDINEQYLAKLRVAAATEETLPAPVTASKRERYKEEKERLLDALRRKNIQQLYRQLAKFFHPDLEQDPGKIQLKEELMKQLIIAKENEDLLSMLQLEIQWIEQEDRHPDLLTNDKLHLYNTTLKEQVKDLQEQIQSLFNHPKYEFLQGFAKTPQSARFIDWKSEKNNLDNLLYGFREIISGLSQDTKSALKVLKGVLKNNT